jgi:hypothetical protein
MKMEDRINHTLYIDVGDKKAYTRLVREKKLDKSYMQVELRNKFKEVLEYVRKGGKARLNYPDTELDEGKMPNGESHTPNNIELNTIQNSDST